MESRRDVFQPRTQSWVEIRETKSPEGTTGTVSDIPRYFGARRIPDQLPELQDRLPVTFQSSLRDFVNGARKPRTASWAKFRKFRRPCGTPFHQASSHADSLARRWGLFFETTKGRALILNMSVVGWGKRALALPRKSLAPNERTVSGDGNSGVGGEVGSVGIGGRFCPWNRGGIEAHSRFLASLGMTNRRGWLKGRGLLPRDWALVCRRNPRSPSSFLS